MMNANQPVREVTVNHRVVLTIAVPMTLAHLSTPLLGLADATVIGQLGDAALLGAVAVAAVLFDFLFWGFGFLRMGTAGLTAQALGADDAIEQRAVFLRALIMAGTLGVGLILLQGPIAWFAIPLFDASDAVSAAAEQYFQIRIWSAPFAFANYAILGWLIGMGRTMTGLVLQIGINLANIVLNIVLALGLSMGIAGVALGTVIAEAAGAMVGIVVVAAHFGGRFGISRQRLFNRQAFLRMIALNRDIMIRTFALLLAFAFFTRQSAQAGDVTLAANAILNNLFLIGGYFLDGIATAAEQLGGRAVGANNAPAFRRAVSLSLLWSLGLAAAMSLALLAGGGLIIDFMTTNEEVRATARVFLIYAALTPLAGAHAFTFDGIYVGATWNRAMRDLMFVALALFFVVWWLTTPLGNHGLWLSLIAFLLLRGACQALAYPFLRRRTFGMA
jgi:MATE family multidrug resistance protein